MNLHTFADSLPPIRLVAASQSNGTASLTFKTADDDTYHAQCKFATLLHRTNAEVSIEYEGSGGYTTTIYREWCGIEYGPRALTDRLLEELAIKVLPPIIVG